MTTHFGSGASATPVRGWTDDPYAPIVEEFQRNFDERDEVGAAFSVVRHGCLVVDVWAGLADATSGREWRDDTLQLIFSGSKGLVAVCMLMLIERGVLDLDAPVARYWPEFAAGGKGAITVSEVVSHRAGLPAVRVPVTTEDLCDAEHMEALLAAQEPLLPPGGPARYHSLSFGWLCGGLVRRADGRTIGRFFQDEVAAPLELELWIGLPAEHEARVSTLQLSSTWDVEFTTRDPIQELQFRNPEIFNTASFPWNSEAFHQAEIPGANAIGTARSVARLYGCLAAGGEINGVRILAEPTVKLGRSEMSYGWQPDGSALAFGVGFQLQTGFAPFGPRRGAFGHGGAGGSLHGAWPDDKVGFSYAMNHMDVDPFGARSRALIGQLARVV